MDSKPQTYKDDLTKQILSQSIQLNKQLTSYPNNSFNQTKITDQRDELGNLTLLDICANLNTSQASLDYTPQMFGNARQTQQPAIKIPMIKTREQSLQLEKEEENQMQSIPKLVHYQVKEIES